ncbi:hypothetical protein L0B53_14085 [Vibrio sp. SS-MA-C1-2]|uniref:hypothetical protein n=1 Tax=Vibrio sp. SS-MA-C1-2 TaxID=2908646 RepID=UPI001F1605A6|nr:hypothetical protein [Vibrio sp. SS-MA-C1-2]UJF18140.1 hypothetical protein L0B53_14085 [Vibrio sp. SS-MA-C1-2]
MRYKLKLISYAVAAITTLSIIGCDNQSTTTKIGTKESQFHQLLEYIPSDTLFFFGQLKPFPIKQYIDTQVTMLKERGVTDISSIYQYETSSAGEEFILRVGLALNNSKLADGQTYIDSLGLSEEMNFYAYMLGAMPAVKFKAEKPEVFLALLDEVEKQVNEDFNAETPGNQADFTYQGGNVDGINYRRYQFDSSNMPGGFYTLQELVVPEQNSAHSSSLYVSVNDNIVTLFLNNDQLTLSDSVLSMALGGVRAATPLQLDDLQQIIKQHNFIDESIGFINHQSIATALTTKDQSLLAKHVYTLTQSDETVSEICNKAFTSIAGNWPRTVLGTDKFDLEKGRLAYRFIIESKNKHIMKALNELQGFIPDFITKSIDPLLSIGVGINADNLVSSTMALQDELATPTYQCQFLSEIQDEISNNSVAELNFITGFTRGLKGISLLIDHLNKNDDFETLDGIITISADDPKFLIDTAKSFLPEYAIDIPTDGTPIVIDEYVEVGSENKVAIKGAHFTLYTGEQGEKLSEGLSDVELSSNALFSINLNYDKFMPLVLKNEEVKQTIDLDKKQSDVLMAIKYKVRFTTSVTDDTITVSMELNN